MIEGGSEEDEGRGAREGERADLRVRDRDR
jgi:hypothetical protein